MLFPITHILTKRDLLRLVSLMNAGNAPAYIEHSERVGEFWLVRVITGSEDKWATLRAFEPRHPPQGLSYD